MTYFGVNIVYVLLGLLILIPILYELSHKFKYYLKLTIYFIFVVSSSFICIPIIIFRPGNVLNILIATYPLKALNVILGLNWKFEGSEHAVVDRSAIVVSNHQNAIDFLGMVYMWPFFRKITAIAKKELLIVQPFGVTAKLCGTRFIDRSKPCKARESMDEAVQYCVDNKVKLWVFPEGTRSMKEEMLPFKKGAFYSAISKQLPIIPVVYSSYSGFIDDDRKIFNSGNIIITCLPPIETVGLTTDDLPDLMVLVRSKMMTKFTEISKKVKQPFPMPEKSTAHSNNNFTVQ